MVRLYDNNFTRDDLQNLNHGDVIIYRENYLIVDSVNPGTGIIFGETLTLGRRNIATIEGILGESE
ncbi:MAG: hypothetical protein OEL87_03750 [Nanoarchaeota archaeon]|nr:hypothetical protein [Nanoarchaeota archaeon]